MTPADEMTAAADKLRAATPAEPAMARTYEPLARWLDNTAISLTTSTHPDWQACVGADALAVARAILGTPDQP